MRSDVEYPLVFQWMMSYCKFFVATLRSVRVEFFLLNKPINSLKMKKSIYAVCAAVVAMFAISFASCSSDVDEQLEEFLIEFKFNVKGTVEDPQAAMALQMMKEEIEAQKITYVGTLSEAQAKFDEAVSKGAELQTAINEFYKNFNVDIQVVLNMSSNGKVINTHVWEHQ